MYELIYNIAWAFLMEVLVISWHCMGGNLEWWAFWHMHGQRSRRYLGINDN